MLEHNTNTRVRERDWNVNPKSANQNCLMVSGVPLCGDRRAGLKSLVARGPATLGVLQRGDQGHKTAAPRLSKIKMYAQRQSSRLLQTRKSDSQVPHRIPAQCPTLRPAPPGLLGGLLPRPRPRHARKARQRVVAREPRRMPSKVRRNTD